MKQLFLILLIGLLFMSCKKQTNTSLTQISALQTAINALQKRCDSLANAVQSTNASIQTTNTNNAALGKSIDSLKSQVATIVTQITTLNSQLNAANANITTIDAQITALNNQLNTLLSQLNSILVQLNGPSSLSTGLVAYYPFTGNANDATGNGHDGTVYGATLTTDRFGTANNAYQFNSNSTNYIKIPISADLNLPDSLTFSAWVNTTNTTIPQRIISKLDEGTPTGWVFDFSTGTGNANKIRVEVGNVALNGGTGIYSFPSFTQNNTWTLLTVTYDLHNVKIYINGQLDTTYPLTTHTQAYLANMIIGAPTNLGTGFFDGKLDEIRIYNRALSQTEITYLATH